jgi:hypothetical protein
MSKYSVVLTRHEDLGGEAYIGYIEGNSITEAISKSRTEVFKADKKDGLHEGLFVQPSMMDYKVVAVFEGHPKLVHIN